MNVFFATNTENFKTDFITSCVDFKMYDDNCNISVDVLVVDGCATLERFTQRRVNTCLCPSSRYYDVVNCMHVESAVSCGMRERDSVTFSSIGEREAMACIKRRVHFFGAEFDPCEFRVRFDRSRGLYANLCLGALEYFIKNYREV